MSYSTSQQSNPHNEPSSEERIPFLNKFVNIHHVGIKNIVLFVWIIGLSAISTLALEGSFSVIFEAASQSIQNGLLKNSHRSKSLFLSKQSAEKCNNQGDSFSDKSGLTPNDVLRCYLLERYKGRSIEEIPPIGIILDEFQTNSWRDVAVAQGSKLKRADYIVLFEILENNLIALSIESTDANTLTISNGILPNKFRFSGADFIVNNEIPLPLEVRNWIKSERNRRNQLKLVDTFFLVIILGALGSIIFLMREHITDDKKNAIRLYVYRPVFGACLAVASFIISISLSGLLSESEFKAEELKTDSVLTLAFAAGLLSEATYNYLKDRASKNFEKPNAQHPNLASSDDNTDSTNDRTEA